jgi:hypothetical protein
MQIRLALHCGKTLLFVLIVSLCIPLHSSERHYSRSRSEKLVAFAIFRTIFSLFYISINIIFANANPKFELRLRFLYLFEVDKDNSWLAAVYTWYAVLITIVFPIVLITLVKDLCSKTTVEGR